MADVLCRSCAVPLDGARELDEGRGDICMSCAIGEVRSALNYLVRQLREGVHIEYVNAETVSLGIRQRHDDA